MRYIKTYETRQNLKRKIIDLFGLATAQIGNRKLEVRRYEYGVTVPTIGEIEYACEEFCKKRNWYWKGTYNSIAFGKGANSVVNYISNYSRVPSEEMIKKWALIEDDKHIKGEVFIAGADFALNYELNKEMNKYNL